VSTAAPQVSIALIAMAGFASGAGMRIMDPLLPLIGQDFGVPTASVSILIAAFMITYGGGQIGTGPAGDRFGKLRVAAIALVLFGIFTIGAEFSGSLTQLALLRAAGGLVSGAVIPLLMAHIGDSVPYHERQAVLGQFLIGNVMSQMLASPISGVLGEYFGWRASFLVFGCFTAAIGLLLAAKLGSAMWRTAPQGARGSGFRLYAKMFRQPSVRLLMVAAFLDGALLFGGAFPFIAAFLIEDFHLSPGLAGLIVASFGLGAFLYTRIARRLGGRLGEKGLLLWGGMGLGAGLLLVAWAPNWQIIAASQIISGFLFYSFHGVLQARATEALPEARATAVSAFAMCLFAGQTTGALVFASIMATAGYRAAFALAGFAMFAVAIWCRLRMAIR